MLLDIIHDIPALSTLSYTLLWVTQLKLRLQLDSRWLFSYCLNGCVLAPPSLRALDIVQMAKTLASNLYWQTPHPPAGPLAVAEQTSVLGKLSFRGCSSTCLVDADSRIMSCLKVVAPEAKEVYLKLELYLYLPVTLRADGCSISHMDVIVALGNESF